MSKTHKERTGGRQTAGETPLIPERYQHFAAIALLFLSLVIFFNQLIFSGKMFTEADILASRSFDTFLSDAKHQGIFPLWNPYIFCGMPSYGSLTVGGDRFFDLSAQILSNASTAFSYVILNPSEGWVLFFYFVFASGIYLFTYQKVKHKFPAFIAAFSATFSMYIIIWVMSGHNTKIAVMAFFPYIFYAVERLREKFSWLLALLLVVLLHFTYMPSHIQMIFYIYLTLGIYFLFFLIRSLLKRKDLESAAGESQAWKGLVRAGVVLTLASALAFAMDSDKYLSVLEYNPYSMRGSNAIVSAPQPGDTKTIKGGLDYDYATSWSFSPGEMMTWLVPSWYGFGQVDYKGFFSNNQDVSANFYWGPQPFTHAPQYMGVIVLILAVIGFVKNRKDPFVQFVGIMIVFSLLIAFGREFPLLYDLMYRYFPAFNKFRIPSMILVMIQVFVPILAAYGITSIMRERDDLRGADIEKRKKSILVAGGVVVGVFVLLSLTFESLLPRQALQNILAPIAQQSLPRDRVVEQFMRQIPAQYMTEASSTLTKMATGDMYVALVLLIVTFGALYYFVQNQMKYTTFIVVLTLVIGFDLWRVDVKPMNPHDKSVRQQAFATPEYIKYLQRDTTLFRVLEFQNGRPPYNNMLAYWRIQSAYGYQGAKMRAYQDMDDVIGMGNPLLWGLMNVKYIISNTPDSSGAIGLVYSGRDMKVYGNRFQLPRAFFVNKYEVADGLTILNKIKDMTFNPREVMYFMEDPKVSVEPVNAAASVDIVRYGIQDLELRTTTGGNNLLFLSETYFPVGWKALLDGKEIPIYRANYLFRAVVVPAGQHKLEMKFEPKGFYLGKNLSLAANILVLGGLGFFGFDYWRKKRTPKQADEQAKA
ncbi:MAG: YfhO family protein [Ignavibacteriales bacterium]|nr:YfhO family protein [Ignavibacteriales bacterium]